MSEDLKKFRKQVMWLSEVRPFQAQEIAYAKSYRSGETISKEH